METLFIGANLIFLPEVDSTNSYAIELLKNVNLPEGSVIHTANQTSGRGQRGNVWNTRPGSNLTVSVVLKPSFLDLKDQFYLYQIAALGCYDVMTEILDHSQFDIKIKWPNDILVDGKKIAGILIENVVNHNHMHWSVMGIGLNVRQGEFDDKIHATSIQILTRKEHDLADVLKLLCSRLEKYYMLLRNGKRETISENYIKHFFGLNKWLDFEIGNQVEKLLVKGVSRNGLLLLEDSSGKEREFDMKEIKWRLR
ncbi:MAG: biotin--[acetyl-CoA-carboxylase] ligase [Bacteroidetes bacterium]|jgi:BirA family biotin operon repressor/biotin-[acetyl-CoA-carboxylase] ligase|nr:biotin--[acetyl-CoA-carboxylase] ligase [Bacteroidota bacterium]